MGVQTPTTRPALAARHLWQGDEKRRPFDSLWQAFMRRVRMSGAPSRTACHRDGRPLCGKWCACGACNTAGRRVAGPPSPDPGPLHRLQLAALPGSACTPPPRSCCPSSGPLSAVPGRNSPYNGEYWIGVSGHGLAARAAAMPRGCHRAPAWCSARSARTQRHGDPATKSSSNATARFLRAEWCSTTHIRIERRPLARSAVTSGQGGGPLRTPA